MEADRLLCILCLCLQTTYTSIKLQSEVSAKTISRQAQIETYVIGKEARYGDVAGLSVLLEHCTIQQMNVSNALSMSAISYFDPIEKMNILLEKGTDINCNASAAAYDRDFIQATTDLTHGGNLKERRFILQRIVGLKM